MEDVFYKGILTMVTYIGAWMLGLLGGYDKLIYALSLMIIFDLFTGVVKGSLNRSEKSKHGGLDSTAFRNGVKIKVMYGVVIAIAVIVDTVVLPSAAVFRNGTICYYIATEGLSILENIAACGCPLPAFLLKALDKIKHTDWGSTK